MKRILLIPLVFLLACSTARGAAISGTIPLTAPIAPTDTADTYPSHLALYGKGGLRTVADNTARDAIPAARREEGMVVFVQSGPAAYRLASDLTTWTQIPIPTQTDWVSLNGSVDTLEANAALARRLSNEAIPLTLLQSSPLTTIGFTRDSLALDPGTGGVAPANSMRAIPLAWGGAIGAAVLSERQATNMPIPLYSDALMFAVRTTISTQAVAGPYGVPQLVYRVTDTADVNSHYIYSGLLTNTPGQPVLASMMFKPLNSTNLNYIFYIGSDTNLNWSMWARASLTNETALPAITYTTNGPVTLHSAGFTPLGNGWWHAYMVATATNSSPVRFGLVPGAFATYAGVTGSPQFDYAGFTFSTNAAATDLPVVSLMGTNQNMIRSKPADVVRYTNSIPWKSSGGSLLMWLRNGFRQPATATLFNSAPSGNLRVEMNTDKLLVFAADQGSGVSIDATIPSLSYFGERQVGLTWTSAGIKAFVDGSLVGSSAAPSGALLFENSGQIGSAIGATNWWNGYIGAAYVPRALSDTEMLFTPYVVGPPNP